MHLPQRGCDAGVREPSQQARLRGFTRDRPQCLDQQDFDKAGKPIAAVCHGAQLLAAFRSYIENPMSMLV